MRYLLVLGFLLTNIVFTNGQDTVNLPLADASDGLTEDGFAEEFRKEYEKRIRKTHINGFYIPADLPDAIRILDEIVDEEGKNKFASQIDTFAVNNVFFSFGRWINVNWGMEQGSRLTVTLNKLGVSYPDDMTRLIMYAWHRHLNKKPLEIEELVKKVTQERYKREAEARKKVQ